MSKEQETEDTFFVDTQGWEYQGKKQQYLWGVWDVKLGRTGNEYAEYWGTFEILPDRVIFRSEIVDVEDYVIEVSEYRGSPFPTRYCSMDSWHELQESYCLEIDVTGLNFGPLTQLFLVNKNQMVGFSGRAQFVLEKIEDYKDVTENKDFTPTEYGFWCGEWEVTESLKTDSEDAEQYIGARFDTERKGSDREEATAIYLVETDEASIKKLVEAMELEEEAFVIFCEFSEDCFWDKMIMKDEMTVVLVKDGNYFWAKRISETDSMGVYGAFI